MKTNLIILFMILSINSFSQQKEVEAGTTIQTDPDLEFKSDYPEGIYFTKAEFIAKKPGAVTPVTPKGIGSRNIHPDSIVHNCYFHYTDSGKKVRNVFAVSYKGHLYFQIKAILKNRNKTDRAQSSNIHNTFVRVIIGGENYLYTEADLVNQWAQGIAYNMGAAGGVAAVSMIKGKGIVWDFKNEEFNIFKSCKDYNQFIESRYAAGVQKCNQHQPDMEQVREAMREIK